MIYMREVIELERSSRIAARKTSDLKATRVSGTIFVVRSVKFPIIKFHTSMLIIANGCNIVFFQDVYDDKIDPMVGNALRCHPRSLIVS